MLWPVPPSGAKGISSSLSLRKRQKKKKGSSKILGNIKSSKEFVTPNCTISSAPRSREKGREKTNDFREKVEACHEPEVKLSWAGLLLNSSQLSFALQGPPAPKPAALTQHLVGAPGVGEGGQGRAKLSESWQTRLLRGEERGGTGSCQGQPVPRASQRNRARSPGMLQPGQVQRLLSHSTPACSSDRNPEQSGLG